MAADPPGPEFRYETLVSAGAEADRFNRAVFLYLERFARADECCATLHSSPEGDAERKSVSLWSAEAALGFALFWRRLNRILARPVAPGDSSLVV